MSFSVPNPPEVELEEHGPRPSGFSPPYRFAPQSAGSLGAVREVWATPRAFIISTDVLSPLKSEVDPLVLSRPVDIETSVVEGGVLWRLGEFDLIAEAADDEHAEAAIREQLLLLRDAYLDEPDENLTPGAQELRNRLRETFG